MNLTVTAKNVCIEVDFKDTLITKIVFLFNIFFMQSKWFETGTSPCKLAYERGLEIVVLNHRFIDEVGDYIRFMSLCKQLKEVSSAFFALLPLGIFSIKNFLIFYNLYFFQRYI